MFAKLRFYEHDGLIMLDTLKFDDSLKLIFQITN